MKLFYIAILFFCFSLLTARWISGGELAGFFLILALACMTLLRWREPKSGVTIAADFLLCLLIYPDALLIVGVMLTADVFYRLGEAERERGLKRRDAEAGKVYEMESLQRDLLSAAARIEGMTAVSERARIAREIHDNAGHEIVAAYISLQAARAEISGTDGAVTLYDAALSRLDEGINKIREAVHNLAPVSAIGADSLRNVCEKFPGEVQFNIFGNTSRVPVHVWNVLEACLNEALTNAAKHAPGEISRVTLDATPHIVRLCVENATPQSRFSGTKATNTLTRASHKPGVGLRNLRHRAASVGGNFSANLSDGKFRAVCVIPIMYSESI
ncbi:MAG: histidine kinase [Defluviitaleaceae bacterium]|nr:histidine kinase [Defluviitaleaceae bacterium]